MTPEGKLIRQGDVLLRPVTQMPAVATPEADQEAARVLARGEKTGHKHVLTAGTMYGVTGPTGKRVFARIESPARLIHDEHAQIDVPAGMYEVIRQRVYAPIERAVRRATGTAQRNADTTESNTRPAWD